MNMYGFDNHKIDGMTILTIVIMAVMGAIGILSLCCGIMGVSFTQLGAIVSVGMITGLSGLLFGVIFLLYLFRH